MSEVSFENFQEPEERSTTRMVRVGKGAQMLTVLGIEDTMAKSGTPGFKVTFSSSVNGAEFTHTFWNTPKALIRIHSLIVGFTGEKLTGTLDTEALSALLVGQSSNCVVDVDIKINGKFRNEYPTLRFTNFANKTVPFADTDAQVNEAKELPKSNDVDDLLQPMNANDELNDLPF